MALEGWPGTPTFTTGQVMSAAAHLNWLAQDVRFCHGAALAPEPTFNGLQAQTTEGGWTTVLAYHIRHESDALVWKYKLKAPPPPDSPHGWARLLINSVEIPGTAQDTTSNSYQTYSGTADLSGLGLTPGDFYKIEVQLKSQDGKSTIQVWQLWQTQSASYPALIAFTDGVTPTAAQWQALSTYAAEIEAQLDAPRGGMMGRRAKTGDETLWFGSLVHRCNDLILSAAFGYEGVVHAGDTMWIDLYVDGVKQNTLTCRFDAYGWPVTAPVAYTFYLDGVATPSLVTGEPNFTPAAQKHWVGLIDASAWGLSVGDVYELVIESGYSMSDDEGPGDVALHYAFETPDGAETVAGYTDPPTWAYADYVYGSTTAKQVQTLATDLAALGAAVEYRNVAAPWWYDFDVNAYFRDSWPWVVRRHRWLHYANEADESPSVRWYDGVKWQETTLEDSGGNRLTFDLASLSRLWPGQRYQLNRVQWAIEDSET